ncbi:hypothetical protein [Vibrio hannami]|uniref:hypothetical protein n=1 Tax=Vibrio hannami TaxID=2717094 RepID=UPI003EBDF3F1
MARAFANLQGVLRVGGPGLYSHDRTIAATLEAICETVGGYGGITLNDDNEARR